jgi:hypothetical protein
VFYAVRSSIDTGGTSPTYQQWQYTVEVSKNLQRRVTVREMSLVITIIRFMSASWKKKNHIRRIVEPSIFCIEN